MSEIALLVFGAASVTVLDNALLFCRRSYIAVAAISLVFAVLVAVSVSSVQQSSVVASFGSVVDIKDACTSDVRAFAVKAHAGTLRGFLHCVVAFVCSEAVKTAACVFLAVVFVGVAGDRIYAAVVGDRRKSLVANFVWIELVAAVTAVRCLDLGAVRRAARVILDIFLYLKTHSGNLAWILLTGYHTSPIF